MDLELAGKGVIVTGASRGIGRSVALAFATEKANLAICARGNEALGKVAEDLRAKGARVHAAACDVGDAKQLSAFLDGAAQALGRVDVLVNNPSAFALADDENGWKQSIDVDLMAAVRATWKVVPWMEKVGGGSIVHISSISGRSAAYPEVYAALCKSAPESDPGAQERLDRIVALGASIGRIKHALGVRGLAGTAARMTVDPPDPQLAAAIEAEVAALAPLLAQLPVLYLPGRQPARAEQRHGQHLTAARPPSRSPRRSPWRACSSRAGPSSR